MGSCFSKLKLKQTSLDWVPVSEYNTRSNCNQTRKQTNNTSDQELTDLDNSVSFESGFGRFVPVRPQPRVLPLTVQNRESLAADHHEDNATSTSQALHPFAHQMQNGLIPHSNHAAAAVMIVNPTTPNAIVGNMSQQFNASNQSRNNLTRNLNSTRNTFEGNNSNNNNTQTSNSRSGTKSVNLMNNMYDQGQGSFNNINENNHVHRESARALGEAIVAACPDAAAVERRLGQIREYIRVTSSLVDTMRNSEDEAFIQHTKEEYDELVKMVMQLRESETKLESMLTEKTSDSNEIPNEDSNPCNEIQDAIESESKIEIVSDKNSNQDKTCNIKTNNDNNVVNLKKVTNIENEHLNKTIINTKPGDEPQISKEIKLNENEDNMEQIDTSTIQIKEIDSIPCAEIEVKKDDQQLNDILRKNIMGCMDKIALIQEMKTKNKDSSSVEIQQDVVVRPVSVQSNGSAYSENDLWQNEIKNKMEISQIRLTALKQQQKRLLKYQAEAKQQLEELNKERQSQEMHHPSTSHENYNGMQNLALSGNYPARMYGANQIGVATTLPQGEGASNMDSAHSVHSHDERFSLRDGNIASSEEAAGGGRDSEVEDDEGILTERERVLRLKLQELQMKKQHMENLVSEFQKLQMATRLGSSHNTYSSSNDDSADDEPSRKCNKSGVNLKNEDPFKLMEIKAIKTALQKTKDLMRSVETFEADNLSGTHEDSFHMPSHSNIHDNKSEGGSVGGWSNEGSVCRVRNSLPQRHKFTNEHPQHMQPHIQPNIHPHMQPNMQTHMQQNMHPNIHSNMQPHVPQNIQSNIQPQIQSHAQQNHETNINSLQELAHELRMETEKIMGERARIKDMANNKERKQKKVNEEVRPAAPPLAPPRAPPGPAERRQLQLRAMLAEKQRELEALLNKEVVNNTSEVQKLKTDSRVTSVVNHHSYNSEQEEPESNSEHVQLDSQNSRDNDNFRAGGDSALGRGTANTAPSRLGSACSDSDRDSASRNKSNQRNRLRRRPTQDRQSEDNNISMTNNSNSNMRHDSRSESSNINMIPPVQNNDNAANMPYPHLPPTCWNTNKSNQDIRTNQFTQNSHSQTMDRLMGTPPMSFPPSLPYNMMMPYGMMGACACGCGLWGAWCWQQLVMQQREIHQLRDQLNHLEERWRAETASHTLNNQVPPGNRANNYWDNFRSYSRQNLLSANSKSNAETQASGAAHAQPQPLVERSHNSLHHTSSSTSPSLTPKRNPPSPDRAASNVNPNLASASRDHRDKASSKLFDLLRENIYSEVTTLIGVNESHPDFLIQLFRELQLISSDPLRQRVLQSIRGVLSQYGSLIDNNQSNDAEDAEGADEAVTTSAAPEPNCHDCSGQNVCSSTVQIDNKIVRFLLMKSEEVFTTELLESLASIINSSPADSRQSRRLLELLSKYEGLRVCDVSSDIIENLPLFNSGSLDEESARLTSEVSESSILQDVAGSLNLFSTSESQLHCNACPYDMWPGHVHVDMDGNDLNDNSPRSSQEGKVDLINCSEMHNGDLAEADQTCRAEGEAAGGALPDVVDADEVTPTEAEAEWLGLDRVPTRLHMEESSEKQKD